jgi:hypothetical protein
MNDEKLAKDYNIEGGSVLHLVSHVSSTQPTQSDPILYVPAKTW